MKIIPLTQGYEALVDDEDFARLAQFRWHVWIKLYKNGAIQYRYAQRTDRAGKRHHMHCDVLGVSSGVDHKDNDGLNNQKSNLRPANKMQNACNQRLNARNTSGFKGVHGHKGKWVAQIGVAGERFNLGTFASAIDAAGTSETTNYL